MIGANVGIAAAFTLAGTVLGGLASFVMGFLAARHQRASARREQPAGIEQGTLFNINESTGHTTVRVTQDRSHLPATH